MAQDPRDRFRDSCANARRYPRNLMDIDHYGPSHETDAELMENLPGLWDAKTTELRVMELYDGEEDIEESCINNSDELRRHLGRNRKDPRYRFVCLEALHSRAPLKCSADMFNALATHHQVSPAFISNILAFGDQTLPRDFNLMTFQDEGNLYARESDLVPLPHLGRSGRNIRHCFNIRTVEPSKSEPDWAWSMRNVAVYHSFDVVTGRSLWLNVKANHLIRTRINKRARQPLFSAKSQMTVEGSFASTLEIIWLIIDWSDENWRGYVNALDAELRKSVIRAKTAQIDRYAKMPEELVKVLKRRATPRPPKRTATFTEKVQERAAAILAAVRAKKTPGNPSSDDEADPEGDRRALDNLSVLKTFTFGELQGLHLTHERINEALLVVGLTIEVIQSITAYYTATFGSQALPQNIRDGCQPDMALFRQRMGNIERKLQIRQKQLASMSCLAQEAKALFDGILQYRNMQISLLFAQSGYDSSKKMENIAHKTEQETTSMHVITFVTLLFLPATFLASFFQSGIIQLNVPDNIDGDWELLRGPWSLYIIISLALMAGVFIIWGIVYLCLRSRAKTRRLDSNIV